jgi:hypothetical protein
MAKEKDAEKQRDTPEEKTEEKTAKKADIRRFLPWITMGVILVFCAGAGFGVGRLFGGLGKSEAEPNSQEQVPVQEAPAPDTSTLCSGKSDAGRQLRNGPEEGRGFLQGERAASYKLADDISGKSGNRRYSGR